MFQLSDSQFSSYFRRRLLSKQQTALFRADNSAVINTELHVTGQEISFAWGMVHRKGMSQSRSIVASIHSLRTVEFAAPLVTLGPQPQASHIQFRVRRPSHHTTIPGTGSTNVSMLSSIGDICDRAEIRSRCRTSAARGPFSGVAQDLMTGQDRGNVDKVGQSNYLCDPYVALAEVGRAISGYIHDETLHRAISKQFVQNVLSEVCPSSNMAPATSNGHLNPMSSIGDGRLFSRDQVSEGFTSNSSHVLVPLRCTGLISAHFCDLLSEAGEVRTPFGGGMPVTRGKPETTCYGCRSGKRDSIGHFDAASVMICDIWSVLQMKIRLSCEVGASVIESRRQDKGITCDQVNAKGNLKDHEDATHEIEAGVLLADVYDLVSFAPSRRGVTEASCHTVRRANWATLRRAYSRSTCAIPNESVEEVGGSKLKSRIDRVATLEEGWPEQRINVFEPTVDDGTARGKGRMLLYKYMIGRVWVERQVVLGGVIGKRMGDIEHLNVVCDWEGKYRLQGVPFGPEDVTFDRPSPRRSSSLSSIRSYLPVHLR
ncbi:hypothetical protein EI94DRAFT_1700749 [Lactarius quietus]|nr:hypothetical protein EI94DRAFT_1700749 [Lactarius quietus]